MSQIFYSFSNGLLLDNQTRESIDRMTSAYDNVVLVYALESYKFVIVGQGWLTLSEFADEIQKTYSIENPQNAEVCRILRKYSQ